MSKPQLAQPADLKRLFGINSGSPCDEAAELLRAFAVARPGDLEFLSVDDVQDHGSSAFDGIPEWDAFMEHIVRCRRCTL